MRDRFKDDPPRRRDVPDNRYLRSDINREFDDDRDYQNFDEAVYGDHKPRQARQRDGRDYNDDHESHAAQRIRQNRERMALGGREYIHDPNATYSRGPARSYAAHESYSENDPPFFTGGQLNQNQMPSTHRMEHGHDPDYVTWRENELNRHDNAYRDWRRAQAESYDTSYGEWRKTRQDQFHKDFTDWRGSQSGSSATSASVTPGLTSDKDKNTPK